MAAAVPALLLLRQGLERAGAGQRETGGAVGAAGLAEAGVTGGAAERGPGVETEAVAEAEPSWPGAGTVERGLV